MTEDEFKPVVRSELEIRGFIVTDIPTANAQTPDFHVKGNAEDYLLELKIKERDIGELQQEAELLRSGNVVERSVAIAPRDTLDAIIRKGHGQMLEHDPSLRCFHLLWIHCTGSDAAILYERFRFTLFGIRQLFSLDRPNLTEAYYFRRNSFWRFRNGLDGVILSAGNGLRLCVNTLSPRVETFRKSQLFAEFKDVLCDPATLEADQQCFIVDDGIDLRDEDAVLAALRRKYGLSHLQPLDMGQYSAFVLSPEGVDAHKD